MFYTLPSNSTALHCRCNLHVHEHIRTSIPEVRPQQNEALIAALKLAMLNNIFSFGDMTFKQMNGTTMGMAPAPPYATIYYRLHESKFLPQYQNHVVFYKHFIDDVLGIWLPHPNPKINSQQWEEITASMNNYPGLTWEFNTPTNKVDFMDITISITNGNISTSLFEKPLNLHLYIPPHSAHPPGLLPSIVHSTLFQIFSL